jgi:hypothetical protein
MGSSSVGVMNSMAFSLSTNSNSKVDGNQISFGTIDFQHHPPTLTLFFASLDQEMDLMFGSLKMTPRSRSKEFPSLREGMSWWRF